MRRVGYVRRLLCGDDDNDDDDVLTLAHFSEI